MATVMGIFKNRDDAEAAVQLLRDNGFDAGNMGLVMREKNAPEESRDDETVDVDNREDQNEATGATVGTVIGSVAGLLAGLSLTVVPGIGPIIAGGTVAAALSGATLGAAGGGLLGSLVKLGVSEDEAGFYEKRVREGGALLTLDIPDRDVAQARSLLSQAGAEQFDAPADAAIATSPTSSTSGIMGVNSAASLQPDTTSSVNAPLRTSTPLLPADAEPSGEKESEFIFREQNDYPSDANDMDVPVPERPTMDRGVEDYDTNQEVRK